jgi:hypothetical protein
MTLIFLQADIIDKEDRYFFMEGDTDTHLAPSFMRTQGTYSLRLEI